MFGHKSASTMKPFTTLCIYGTENPLKLLCSFLYNLLSDVPFNILQIISENILNSGSFLHVFSLLFVKYTRVCVLKHEATRVINTAEDASMWVTMFVPSSVPNYMKNAAHSISIMFPFVHVCRPLTHSHS